MITRTNAFQTSDNKTHASLEDAQRHEVELLMVQDQSLGNSEQTRRFAIWTINNAEKVVDILTTTATSKPKARKINGGTKKRNTAAALNAQLQDTKP